MNELTKDDLLIILLEMNSVIRRTEKQGILRISPIFFELRDKIQSMIDTYCEHSWVFHFSSDGSQIKCQKCSKEL